MYRWIFFLAINFAQQFFYKFNKTKAKKKVKLKLKKSQTKTKLYLIVSFSFLSSKVTVYVS